MNCDLIPTDALRAALVDAAAPGTAAITFTRLAGGTGLRAAGATAADAADLRAQTVTAPVESTASGGAIRIALTATWDIRADQTLTEMGLFARQGAGDEFLAAYCAEDTAEDGQEVTAGTQWVQTVVVTTAPGSLGVTLAAPDITVAAPTRLIDLADVVPNNPILAGSLLRAGLGGNMLAMPVIQALSPRALLFDAVKQTIYTPGAARGVDGPRGAWIGTKYVRHTFQAAIGRDRLWLIFCWGAGGRSGSVTTRNPRTAGGGGSTRLSRPNGSTICLAHGGREGSKLTRDPVQPRASDIAPYGHYVVIQGAGAGGGEPGTANYGRGEHGAFAVGLHQASAGETYYADVGVGGSPVGPAGGGDQGAMMIVEIGA